jgi:CHAT domain-containing protein
MRTPSNNNFIGALVLALALLVSDPAIGGEADWLREIDAGVAARKAGDFQSAIHHSEAALIEVETSGLTEKHLSATLQSLWLSLVDLATRDRDQGRYDEAERLFKRAVLIYERLKGSEHPGVATVLAQLTNIYFDQFRYEEAEAVALRAYKINEKAFGFADRHTVFSANGLAQIYLKQARFADAAPLIEQSRKAQLESGKEEGPEFVLTLINSAMFNMQQGRFALAEEEVKHILVVRDREQTPVSDLVAASLEMLAEVYIVQGRAKDAGIIVERVLGMKESLFGIEHERITSTLHVLAFAYAMQGRLSEAEILSKRALEIRERTFGPQHPDVALSLNKLATIYLEKKQFEAAELLQRRALAISENSPGRNSPDNAFVFLNRAETYRGLGRDAEAELSYKSAMTIFERVFGADHLFSARCLIGIADLYRAQGKVAEALVHARHANELLAKRFVVNSNDSRRGALSEQRTHSEGFELHISLLAAVAERGSQVRAEAAPEGFIIAQLARASDTAEQVAKMSARYAAGSDALAQLARARQDALARLEQLDSRIVQAAGQRGNETLAARLRTEEAETRKAIAELDARLEREYPQYRELTNPKPLELAAAQRLLAEDEALVLLLVSTDESFLWVLRRGEAGFFKLALKRDELVRLVKRLRAQLDLGAGDPDRIIARPFNVATAHELYRKILGPAETLLTGVKQLILVPDGAMQSLPPGVLVTELPAKPIASLADHARVAWLAKKYAITVLPAAGSLRALRQFARAPASREPFGGFGDPVLEGRGEGARRATIPALYSRGAVADANEVRKLARLPESAGELRAIAAALNAPAASIRLGAAATERAVKEADLTRYRNLAFATHGLMAGDFKGLAEPALVLTPPEKGSEIDDGLLTAGEISQLKLDADWVILSACNTAAPDGTPGAEGLSGLTKAFFYAGARSLLVSHWAVSSDAAVALTTRMFDESSKGAPKAEALRRSMLALMARTDKPYFAHPAFWAPFVLVGEGGGIRQ